MIIIITKNQYQTDLKDILIIHNEVTLLSDYQLLYNNQTLDFDYLIIEDLSLCHDLEATGMLLDEGLPVTNYVCATSLDNIYYGDIDIALSDLMNTEDK